MIQMIRVLCGRPLFKILYILSGFSSVFEVQVIVYLFEKYVCTVWFRLAWSILQVFQPVHKFSHHFWYSTWIWICSVVIWQHAQQCSLIWFMNGIKFQCEFQFICFYLPNPRWTCPLLIAAHLIYLITYWNSALRQWLYINRWWLIKNTMNRLKPIDC